MGSEGRKMCEWDLIDDHDDDDFGYRAISEWAVVAFSGQCGVASSEKIPFN